MSHLTRQTLSIGHAFFCGFFCLCVVIGLPMLFLGCNPDVDNMCLTYNVVEATTYGIRNETKTCQDCEKKQCGPGTCEVCGPSYVCYRGFVQLNYGDPDDNCEYSDRKKFNTAQGRDDYYKLEYPIGSTHNFLVRPGKPALEQGGVKECEKVEIGLGTWTAGVVFLCLAGITLFAWIFFGFATYSSWKANVTSAPAPPRYTGYGNGTYVPNSPSPYTSVNSQVEMVSVASNSPYPAVTTVTPYPSVNAYPTSTAQRPVSVPITPTMYSTTPAASNSSPYNPQYTPTHVAVSAVGTGTATSAAVRPQSTPVYAATTTYPAATPYSSTIPVTNNSSVAPHSVYEEYDMY